MDGASEYYYYASLTAQESITAEKIKSEGQKIEPDTFAELEVKPGYSGGNANNLRKVVAFTPYKIKWHI